MLLLKVIVLLTLLLYVNSYKHINNRLIKSNNYHYDVLKAATWQEDVDTILNIDTNCDNRRDIAIGLFSKANNITNDVIDSLQNRDISKIAPPKLAYGKAFKGLQEFQKQLVNDIIPELLTKTLPKVIEKGPQIINDIVKNGPDDAVKRSNEIISTITQIPNDPSLLQSTIDDLRREIRNIVQSTPEGLDSPSYTVEKKTDNYEIRKYSPYGVCSVQASDVETSTSDATNTNKENTNDIFTSGNNFNTLASYIFGDNVSDRKLSMTTPVIMKGNDMEFVLPNGMNSSKAPVPKSNNVILKDIPAELIAVKEFSGICTEGEISKQRALLEDMLLSDGILYDNLSFRVLQYNPPYTLPWIRRNEVCLKVDMDINQTTLPSNEAPTEIGDVQTETVTEIIPDSNETILG